MEKNKINYGLIFLCIIVALLFVPIIMDYVKKLNIEVLSSNEISEKIKDGETFLVYVGDVDKNTKKELRKMRDLTKNQYSYEYGVYSVKDSNEIQNLLGDNVKVSIVIEGDIQKTYNEYDKKDLTKDVNKYFLAKITDENASYKVAENYNAYKKLVKGEDTIVSVFGTTNCGYCNKFKPVYDAVAEKYDIDIYYFDSLKYDQKQYKKIINIDLVVPAKCSSNGSEFKLSDGFGTPLTIITKKNKVVDCIRGYRNRSALIEIFKSNNLISE